MSNFPAVQQPPQSDEPQPVSEEIDEENEAAPAADAKPMQEKKPEGIEHDPYEWGKCAITANIVWLPDGSVMLGVRSHLDAPILTILSGEALTTLPGHAAELPLPTLETIADLLAALREDLPLRAKAKADREEAVRKKAEEQKTRREPTKKGAKTITAKPEVKISVPAKPVSLEKTPAATQVSLFSMLAGGN